MALSWFKRLTKPQPAAVSDSSTEDSAAETAADSPANPNDISSAWAREEWLTPPHPQPAAIEIPSEKIAQRAYEKWVQRGCVTGSPDQDWLEAEAELRAESAAATVEPLPHRSR